MTSVVAPQIPAPIERDQAPPRRFDRSRSLALLAEGLRARFGLVGVGLLATVLYVWNLAISGYANTYYSAAALAASQSWTAWFFGSLDAGNFITVDKPPLSTMLMGLSVRVFGLSSWSILLPQALLGIATVLLTSVERARIRSGRRSSRPGSRPGSRSRPRRASPSPDSDLRL